MTAPESAPGELRQVTGYQYDSRGRLTHVTHADSSVTRYDYYPTGDLRKTWGSRTSPVEYTYDAQGRMKTMRTWKEFDQSSGAGTSGSATTTWNYDPQRGFLTSKVYPDSQTVSYTYDAAGRIQTRTWARGVVTTYGYNNAGDLASVTYSDDTPSVTLAWNRVGQKEEASDGTGDYAWWYDFYGRVEYDVYMGENDSWSWVGHDYDALGRLAMKDIQPLSNSAWRYSYSYDDAGRLHRITYNDQDPAPRAAEYDYNSATGRIHDIHFLEGEDTVVSTRKLWDGLGRQTDAYGYNTSMLVQARRSHEYNDANQITRTIDESNSYWDYGYDDLGQVTSGQKSLSDGTLLDGHDLGYSYDAIGNRTTTVTNGRSAIWTSNAVNQYTSREVPGAVDIFGMAGREDSVTVNGDPASRQQEHFYHLLNVPNASSARYEEVTVETANAFGMPRETVTGYSFLPKAPEVFSYDADGNLLSDGRWNYTWDAENRLTRVETRADLPSHMPRKRIDYQYDFMGRRFMMRAYEWDGAEWVFYLWERYLYDGWTLAGREGGSVNGQRTQHYLWGLDESGTLGGAGDVGGLLMIRDIPSGKTYHPTIDANGNVIALWDADTAEVAAYYDYDPFGKTVRATGSAAEVSPFRFSTKYQDVETGFYYYGFRYYSPSMGRWLNRDPINEAGSMLVRGASEYNWDEELNLYAFVGNDGVNLIDSLGLKVVGEDKKTVVARFVKALDAALRRASRRMSEECVRLPSFPCKLCCTATGLAAFTSMSLAHATATVGCHLNIGCQIQIRVELKRASDELDEMMEKCLKSCDDC